MSQRLIKSFFVVICRTLFRNMVNLENLEILEIGNNRPFALFFDLSHFMLVK